MLSNKREHNLLVTECGRKYIWSMSIRNGLQIYLIIVKTLEMAWRTPINRAVRYDDIYRMDEIKSLSLHIMLYRLFRGVTKYIVSGNTFSSFEWLRSLYAAHHGAWR